MLALLTFCFLKTKFKNYTSIPMIDNTKIQDESKTDSGQILDKKKPKENTEYSSTYEYMYWRELTQHLVRVWSDPWACL